MNLPISQAYRLVARGGAGLSCDATGLALGGAPLTRCRPGAEGRPGCEARSADEIELILRAAFGAPSRGTLLRVHRGLGRAASAIEAGDLGRAAIEAVRLRLPEVTPDAMLKLAHIARLEKQNASWPTEPRVPRGQSGGGQWTTGGASPTRPAATAGADRRQPPPRPRPSAAMSAKPPAPIAPNAAADATDAVVSGLDVNSSAADGGDGIPLADRGLIIPASAVMAAPGGFGGALDMAPPAGLARMGRLGLLAFGAAMLSALDNQSAKSQINQAIARFGLNPSQPRDVIAASAYVWSTYALPLMTAAPFRGPALDAAAQTVMRCALVNPRAFLTMRQDSNSARLILLAANAGLSDYAVESRARPAGVDPALQTTSYSARKAIGDALEDERMAVHHLVPVSIWSADKRLEAFALLAGWKSDLPLNLIGLPKDPKTQADLGGRLPMHRGPHGDYTAETQAMISEFVADTPEMNPQRARAILEAVALINRINILAGKYNPLIKITP